MTASTRFALALLVFSLFLAAAVAIGTFWTTYDAWFSVPYATASTCAVYLAAFGGKAR